MAGQLWTWTAWTVAVVLGPLLAGTALYTAAVYTGYFLVRGGRFGGMANVEDARPWRAMVVEFCSCLWVLLVGLFTAPFPRVRLSRGTPGGVPVLCVHGYTQNWGNWLLLAPRLARSGSGPVYGINLRRMFGSIEDGARDVVEALRRVAEETGAARVDVVCHSMGGLVTRTAMARHGADALVRRVVTLGTPHHGTLFSRLGPGTNAREMEPGSAFLAGLPPPPPGLMSVWSTTDGIVLPPENSRCGTAETVFHDLGHLSLLLSPRVHQAVIHVLRAPE